MPAISDDFKHHDNNNDDHHDKQQFNFLDINNLDLDYNDIQHHNNDNHHGGAMHRRLHMALERGWPDMAALRHRQLQQRVLMSGADITGDD